MDTFGSSTRKHKNSGLQGLSVLDDDGSEKNILPNKVVFRENSAHVVAKHGSVRVSASKDQSDITDAVHELGKDGITMTQSYAVSYRNAI